MARLAKELGKQTCLWGGVSAPMHIGEGRPEEVRAAVRQAVEIFGRRGFILTAVPSIRPHWAWENVVAMLDEWRKVR
jgi:uroporphyrinogen-III decarboxylase